MHARAIAIALGSLLAAPAALAQPAPEPPAARTITLGADQVTALKDAGFVMPNNGKVFGLNATPAEVGEVLKAAGAPPDKISLSVDALLVRMPGHVVLLDTGLGPMAHGALIRSLELAHVPPADVTDVLITHSHGDHVGGLLDAQGHSAFPKATIWMSAKEWPFLKSQPRSKVLADAIAPQVKTFEPGKPLLPGITPVALYGHTPGHVGYIITSQGKTMEDIGDIAHSSIISLARPDWTVQFDNDQAQGVATRETELARLAKAHELVFAPHFPFPGLGRIQAKGKGYVWVPIPAKP